MGGVVNAPHYVSSKIIIIVTRNNSDRRRARSPACPRWKATSPSVPFGLMVTHHAPKTSLDPRSLCSDLGVVLIERKCFARIYSQIARSPYRLTIEFLRERNSISNFSTCPGDASFRRFGERGTRIRRELSAAASGRARK